MVEMEARKLKLESEQVLTVTEAKIVSSPRWFSCSRSGASTMFP